MSPVATVIPSCLPSNAVLNPPPRDHMRLMVPAEKSSSRLCLAQVPEQLQRNALGPNYQLLGRLSRRALGP